jgi:hypothetical protein
VPSDLAAHEYRALREAIAARGQLRAALALAGLLSWAGVLTAILIALPYPVAAIVPLTVLIGTFEAIRPLHVGAERIGRYVQVFFEETATDSTGPLAPPVWEQTAMVFGSAVPGAAGHPLFGPLFAIATLVNLLAVLLPGPVAVELSFMAVPHGAFLIWIVWADRVMRGQRARELARFRELRDQANTKDTKDTKDTRT